MPTSQYSRTVTDSLTVTDSVAKRTGKRSQDAISIAESRLQSLLAKTLQDMVRPVDERLRRAISLKPMTDSLSLIDQSISSAITTMLTAVRRFLAEAWQRLFTAQNRNDSYQDNMLHAYKDSASIEDFQIDFSDMMVAPDTILYSQWIVPSGMTLVQSSNTQTSATARLEGGVAGKSYLVGAEVTLASGQVLVERLKITIGPS